MIYGFSGAHRTGKSTLANAMAKDSDGIFLPINVASVLEKHGVNGVTHQKDDLETFMRTQSAILDHMESVFRGCEPDLWYWVDRTPLDVLTYTQAYANMAFFEDTEKANRYYELFNVIKTRCKSLLNRYFEGVFLVTAGIPVVPDAKSAVAHPSCIDHIETLMTGNLCKMSIDNCRRQITKPFYYVVPTDILDLTQRQVWCWTIIMENTDVRSDELH